MTGNAGAVAAFSADWLALREPADTRSRAVSLETALLAWVKREHDRRPGPLRVVDMGAGTGSNLRHLAPRLGNDQHWLLLDNDAALLANLRDRLVRWVEQNAFQWRAEGDAMVIRGNGFSARVATRRIDLSAPAEDWLPAAFDAWQADAPAGPELLTASALLDLVGEAWLEAMVAAAAGRACAALMALSYDGDVSWSPSLAGDALVLDAFNTHQCLDKGLGPALGPVAGRRAADAFAHAGYRVNVIDTPWQLAPDDAALQAAIIADWSETLAQWRPAQASALGHWRRARLHALAQSTLRIAHVDLLALR